MNNPLLALAGPTGARTRPLAWASLAVLVLAAFILLAIRACSNSSSRQADLREYEQDQQRIQQSPPAPLDARPKEHLRALHNH